ncbi:MAG: hypothetical protein OXI60_06460 [Acidiferrobacterales bacterium]|nr:hypothetical protein [Acidiferrobacterales bacterium]
MQFVSADQVHQACACYPSLVNALETFHRETPADLKDMLLSSPQEEPAADNHLLIRAAWSHGSVLGLKAASVFPNNSKFSDLPAIHAIYALYDGKDGVPAAVIDGTAMTYYKTAADSALGSKLLANSNPKSMAMIGAGAMAPHLIRAHCAVHTTIDTVTIWNRTFSRAQTLADSMSIDRVEIEASQDIESTVRNAELISSATMTVDPIIRGNWLSPGSHLDLIGAYRLDMREADDDAIQRSRIFVDSRKTTIGEIGEITIPIEAGVIAESDVRGDLYELCCGSVRGRNSTQDVTLFKNGGGGHLDLMTARYIYDKFR